MLGSSCQALRHTLNDYLKHALQLGILNGILLPYLARFNNMQCFTKISRQALIS